MAMSAAHCAPLISWLFMLRSLNDQTKHIPNAEFCNSVVSKMPDNIVYALGVSKQHVVVV